jgi:hypothetical protein
MKNILNNVLFIKPFTHKKFVRDLAIILAFAGAISICTEKTRANLPYLYLAGSAVGTVLRKGCYEKRKRDGTLTFLTTASPDEIKLNSNN